jgi:NAD(P)-dependent dehydrogenase (short-subunit alcohol dehydrogenase family)
LGAKVAVTDLNLRSYEEFEAEAKDMTADSTVGEIEASGDAAIGIEVDVRDHEAVEAMVGRVAQKWGRVDVLVANAGGGSQGCPRGTVVLNRPPITRGTDSSNPSPSTGEMVWGRRRGDGTIVAASN